MHCDTFRQDNYSTVGGDGGCRVVYQNLFTDCFMKISPQSLEQIQSRTVFVPTIEEKS